MRQRKLMYDRPAKSWYEALPLGSGKLGAMVFGNPYQERIGLNLDSFWSGDGKRDKYPKNPTDLKQLREYILAGKHTLAEEYVKEHMLGDWTECYLPAGDLWLERVGDAKKEDVENENLNEESQRNAAVKKADSFEHHRMQYARCLDLEHAIYEEQVSDHQTKICKQVWISLQRDVLVVEMAAESGEACLNFDINLTSKVKHSPVKRDLENEMELSLQAPIYAAPSYFPADEPIRYEENAGMQAKLAMKVLTNGGEVKAIEDKICVRGAKSLYILLTGETDFKTKEDLSEIVWKRLDDFLDLNLDVQEQIGMRKQEHIAMYRSYFDRMDLELGEGEGVLKQDEVVRAKTEKEPSEQNSSCNDMDFQEVQDTVNALQASVKENALYALMFHYARYLMISSSKPNTECANLQGIWNEHLRAPWSSNYTVNINTQMNYWFVEGANLSECHLPLFDLMERAVEKGRECARRIYGLDGFVTHHNIDLWGHATLVGYKAVDATPSQYSVWPMSSGWLCRHLMEHFWYTNDMEFLRNRAYPIILEAVKFYLGYLSEVDGILHTIPSTSPENVFVNPNAISKKSESEKPESEKSKSEKPEVAVGDFENASDSVLDIPNAAMTISSTMDISILRELFTNYAAICDLLGRKRIADIGEVLKKLPKPAIGKYNQLQEWFFDYEESDVHHRHVSHLYGLYPAQEFGMSKELCEGARVSLQRRGSEGTGWCIAWKTCLYARLSDGEKALELLNNQLRLTREESIQMIGGGTYPNLFCAHPPFQIDGNFGFAAAVLEMLMQCDMEKITLLPALPKAWGSGRIRGMKARGGHEITFTWKNHRIQSVELTAGRDGEILLIFGGERRVLDLKAGQKWVL